MRAERWNTRATKLAVSTRRFSNQGKVLAFWFLLASSLLVQASGPRWVAGSSYFDPAAKGVPIRWQNGVVNYYTDLGDLSGFEPQNAANILVVAAANAWNSVPTAAVQVRSSSIG